MNETSHIENVVLGGGEAKGNSGKRLVILVVYIFLQGWRATLLLAVPVSLAGTSMLLIPQRDRFSA